MGGACMTSNVHSTLVGALLNPSKNLRAGLQQRSQASRCDRTHLAVLVAEDSSASNVVRGASASPAYIHVGVVPYAVQYGDAQRCPLSPLLYATFADPMLQDMQGLLHPDLVWVRSAAARPSRVGQAYKEYLAGIAASQQGLQCVVQALAQLSTALFAYCEQVG